MITASTERLMIRIKLYIHITTGLHKTAKKKFDKLIIATLSYTTAIFFLFNWPLQNIPSNLSDSAW